MGNWLYKEWSQIEQYDEFATVSANKQNKNTKLKRRSLTNFATITEVAESPKETAKPRRNSLSNTPINNKVVVADFDPRSPSSGIQR
jgi:hypothetical protein